MLEQLMFNNERRVYSQVTYLWVCGIDLAYVEDSNYWHIDASSMRIVRKASTLTRPSKPAD